MRLNKVKIGLVGSLFLVALSFAPMTAYAKTKATNPTAGGGGSSSTTGTGGATGTPSTTGGTGTGTGTGTPPSTSKDSVCEGIGLATGQADPCNNVQGTNNDVSNTIALIINMLSVLVGVVAVIMIIIGGFKYITSSGDSASVTSAKNTILFAIVGLVIVALAQVIVVFVLNKVKPT